LLEVTLKDFEDVSLQIRAGSGSLVLCCFFSCELSMILIPFSRIPFYGWPAVFDVLVTWRATSNENGLACSVSSCLPTESEKMST
jgi:hypothetical protein